MKFRNLFAHEIDCRVQSIGKTWCNLLLFKDARCDMLILDETVGPENWQRHHTRDNKNCIVSIWSEKRNQWIEKEDVGTESNTDKEKGLASDSFKRACFNWGIGRELYTSPKGIYITPIRLDNGKDEFYEDGKDNRGRVKYKTKTKFHVYRIAYFKDDNGNETKFIAALEIHDHNNRRRFIWSHPDYHPSNKDNTYKVDENDFHKPPAEEHPKQYYLERLKNGHDKGHLSEIVYNKYKSFSPVSKHEAEELIKDAISEMKQ